MKNTQMIHRAMASGVITAAELAEYLKGKR